MKTPFLIALCVILIGGSARASDESDWKRLEAQGKKALEKNEFTQAEALFMQAAEKAETFGKDDERYAKTLRRLGQTAVQLQDYANADFAYTRLVRADGARLGTNDLRVAEDLLHLTEVCGYTEQFLRAHESIDAATTIVASKLGEYSPGIGMCHYIRGGLDLQENHLAAADMNYQRAVDLLEKTVTVSHFGPGLQMERSYFEAPQSFVADALNNLSICQVKEKKYDEAEASLKRAIGILEHDYGRNSVQLVTSLANLGNTYLAAVKWAEAEVPTRRALEILRKVDPAHPMVSATRDLMARILTAEGKEAEAAKYRQP